MGLFLDEDRERAASEGELARRGLVSHLNERAVSAVAHAGAHEERQVKQGEERVSRCTLYETVSCTEHHTTHDQVMESLFDAAPQHPTLAVCDASGALDCRILVLSCRIQDRIGICSV